MPVIRIDDEVYRYLEQRVRAFGDTPNDVLRRLFELDQELPRTKDSSEGLGDGSLSTRTRTVVPAALTWLHRELGDPDSSISVFLTRHGHAQRPFDFYRRRVRASKYFRAQNAYPGIDSYWHSISPQMISEIDDLFPFVLLMCQKEPDHEQGFWCLAVPFEYIGREHSKGNLGTLGGNICLHLSAHDCIYRGQEVKRFDDVRLTMRTGHKPTQFRQFQL